jgi:hypothetical protein
MPFGQYRLTQGPVEEEHECGYSGSLKCAGHERNMEKWKKEFVWIKVII